MSFAQSVTQLPPSWDDHELVVAVRGGNDRAFAELYSRYGSKIRAYVLGMVGDQGRAEDVTQEVFISALRRLGETERVIILKPWLYEIARNACIDEFRRRRRAHEVSLDGSSAATEGERFVSWAPAPEAAIENKQRLDDLRGAFGGLSENHHRIIVMRELEGLSYEEIGKRMGMTKPVVESNLFRARRRLHAEYDELLSGRRCEQVQTVIATGGERPASSFGARERRQLARHLSHCQPCRRAARMAGVDESWFHVPGLVGKIAALLPFPWLRLRRGSRGGATSPAAGHHPISALRPFQAMAQLADPSGPAFGLGRAATAAAALVVAGAGGGIVVGLNAPGAHRGAAVPRVRALSPAAAVVSRARPSHRAAGRGTAPRSRTGRAAVRGARAHTGMVGGRTSSARTTPTGTSVVSSKRSTSSAAPPPRSAGAAAGVLGATGKLGSTVLSGPGLLGGSGSKVTGLLPKLPNLGLPSLPNVLRNTLNGTPSAPSAISGLPLPSLPLPSPGGILPPLGHHSP